MIFVIQNSSVKVTLFDSYKILALGIPAGKKPAGNPLSEQNQVSTPRFPITVVVTGIVPVTSRLIGKDGSSNGKRFFCQNFLNYHPSKWMTFL
jgi:hypothetical protein